MKKVIIVFVVIFVIICCVRNADAVGQSEGIQTCSMSISHDILDENCTVNFRNTVTVTEEFLNEVKEDLHSGCKIVNLEITKLNGKKYLMFVIEHPRKQ